MAIEPRTIITSFIERDKTVSDWLHASVIESLSAALGDAEAIALASWHEEQTRKIKGLVACRGGEWLLVTVRPDDRHGAEVVAHETTTSFGNLEGVGLVTHRMFACLPRGPVNNEVHALHLRHEAFPGGKVQIELHDPLLSDSRDEIVDAFRAACSAA